ncbi:MAG: DUF6465 family protein [Lachnospiraceae bacterium]
MAEVKKATAAKKTDSKKEEVKKTAEKKKPAAKRETVKEGFYVQFSGKDLEQSDVIRQAKEDYKTAGNKAGIKSIDVYVKPEESAVYYVVNGDVKGRFEV